MHSTLNHTRCPWEVLSIWNLWCKRTDGKPHLLSWEVLSILEPVMQTYWWQTTPAFLRGPQHFGTCDANVLMANHTCFPERSSAFWNLWCKRTDGKPHLLSWEVLGVFKLTMQVYWWQTTKPHLLSWEVLGVFKLLANGVMRGQPHGIDNHHSASQHVQGLLHRCLCHQHVGFHFFLQIMQPVWLNSLKQLSWNIVQPVWLNSLKQLSWNIVQPVWLNSLKQLSWNIMQPVWLNSLKQLSWNIIQPVWLNSLKQLSWNIMQPVWLNSLKQLSWNIVQQLSFHTAQQLSFNTAQQLSFNTAQQLSSRTVHYLSLISVTKIYLIKNENHHNQQLIPADLHTNHCRYKKVKTIQAECHCNCLKAA